MNQRLQELFEEAYGYPPAPSGEHEAEKFALSIVYDFLSELTNDDSLGQARIATIRRLAKKWGVER